MRRIRGIFALVLCRMFPIILTVSCGGGVCPPIREKYMNSRRSLLASLSATTAIIAAGGAFAVAPPPAAPATQALSFSIHMPLRNTDALKAALTSLQTPGSLAYNKFITPAQFNAQYGPTAATMAAATQALTAAGLKVVATNGRSIQVSGTVAQANALFHVTLRNTVASKGAVHTVSITPPIIAANSALAGAVIPAFAPIPDRCLARASGPRVSESP